MIQLDLSWEGRDAADFSRVFKAAAVVKTFKPVFKEIGEKVIAPSIQKSFDQGGFSPPWRPLAPATVAKKSAMGVSNPSKILVHSGALEKAATDAGNYKYTATELRAQPYGIDYYRYHQVGDGLPQRVIMRLTAIDRTKINTIFATYLRGFINFNPAAGGRAFSGGQS